MIFRNPGGLKMAFFSSPEPDIASFDRVINALIALAGLVLTAILAWLKDLTDISRRTRQVDYMSKRAELWTKLLELQLSLGEKESVKKSLRTFVQGEVTAVKNYFALGYEFSFERRHFSNVGLARRWLLLYQPLSRWSWLFRVVFYLCGTLLCWSAMSFLRSVLTQENWRWSGSLFAVVFFGCLVLRSMCLRNDERNYDWDSMWKDLHDRSEKEVPRDIEEGSASAISQRLHSAVGLAGRVNAFSRRLTVAAIAELIGEPSTQRIESAIRGDEALPFCDSDKICDLLSLHREWLLDNDSDPFYQKARYVFASDFLHAIGRAEIRNSTGSIYDQMIFVLSADDSARVAIFGHTHRTPYKVDLLLVEFLSDWDVILVCATTAVSSPVSKLVQNADIRRGMIFESSEFRKLVDGHVHPGVILELSIDYSHWNEDIWDLDREDELSDTYTVGYQKARANLKSELRITASIRSNADLAQHVEERLRRHGSGSVLT